MTKRFFGAWGGANALGALAFTLGASLSAVMLTGCGGHHSSSSANDTTLTATIDWPAHSREISNVSAAAVAAIITVTTGDPSTGDPVDFPPILRLPPPGTGIAAFSQTWTSPTQVARGNTHIQIRFYSTLPTGTTSSIANDTIASEYKDLPSVGDAYFPLTVGDTTTDLGTIAVTGTIATLTVPSQTVNFGNSATLGATALDATGKIMIALPGGSVFYTGPTDLPVTVSAGGTVVATDLGTGPVTVGASISGAATASGTLSTMTTVTSIVGASQLTTQSDGLAVRDTVLGSGSTAANGNSVSLTYTGYYSTDPANNVDSGAYAPFDTAFQTTVRTVTLGDGTLPAALNEAVIGIQPGGTRIVVIPVEQTAGLGIPPTAPTGAPGIYIIRRM